MTSDPTVLAAIAGMAVITYVCRVLGFWLMRFVRPAPRVEAWLQAVPIATLGALLAGAAARGGPPEWLGLAVALLAMKLSGSDLLGIAGGVGTVALLRLAGA